MPSERDTETRQESRARTGQNVGVAAAAVLVCAGAVVLFGLESCTPGAEAPRPIEAVPTIESDRPPPPADDTAPPSGYAPPPPTRPGYAPPPPPQPDPRPNPQPDPRPDPQPDPRPEPRRPPEPPNMPPPVT